MTETLELRPAAGTDLDWSAFAPRHRLGDTDWHVWGLGLLRSAGFPISGIDRLGGRRAAAAAAAHLAGGAGHDAFVEAYEADAAAETEQFARLAGDDALRRALAWQNPTFFRNVDSLATRRLPAGSKRRSRERALAQYWQRYCAKADTIGFFGPAAWIPVGETQQALDAEPGPELVARGRVFFERWAVAELAEWMIAQPGARWWFPPLLRPDVHLDGDRALLPNRSTVRLREDEALVAGYADGDRNGDAIVEALVAGHGWDPAAARDRVEKALNRLLRQRLLTWDSNIPVDVRAEEILRGRVRAIADPDLFVRFEEVLTRLDGLREQIAQAEDADRLAEALGRLDEYFEQITGGSANRAQGKMYAGRTVCYQDCLRDVRVSLGRDFFDRLAPALSLVCDAADWLGERLAEIVEAEVARLVREAAARSRTGTVTLADVWPQILALFWGPEAHKLHAAAEELGRRWDEVLAVDPRSAGSRVRLSSAEIADRVRAAFPVSGRLWPQLAVHSPDLQIAAASVEAVNAGQYTVVLGELHACLATLDLPFLDWTTDHGSLRDKLNAALDGPRILPLLPTHWHRNAGRMVPAPYGAGDRLIGFTRAPYDDRSRVDAAVAIELREKDGAVDAIAPDGKVWRLPELLAIPIAVIAQDAFKIGLDRPHAPRVSLDDLVLFRETWRLPVSSIELPGKPDRYRDYLAVRRWLTAHGLPDQVFAKFPEEVKPSLVDFTSPTLVLSFATLARAARQLDPDAVVSLSEPLPAAGESWLPDARGERYVSELRLQISRKAP